MRPILLTLAFPLKVVHRLYGYASLVIVLTAGAAGLLALASIVSVAILFALAGGAVWFITTLLLSVVGTGVLHLIRALDPKYMEGKKDVTKATLDGVSSSLSRVMN